MKKNKDIYVILLAPKDILVMVLYAGEIVHKENMIVELFVWMLLILVQIQFKIL
jgi:hypothetical protein